MQLPKALSLAPLLPACSWRSGILRASRARTPCSDAVLSLHPACLEGFNFAQELRSPCSRMHAAQALTNPYHPLHTAPHSQWHRSWPAANERGLGGGARRSLRGRGVADGKCARKLHPGPAAGKRPLCMSSNPRRVEHSDERGEPRANVSCHAPARYVCSFVYVCQIPNPKSQIPNHKPKTATLKP